MVDGFHQGPDDHILSLKAKRVMDRACCKDPYPDPSGRCKVCSGNYRPGQEAYSVVIQLPNGVSLSDPQVQNRLGQVVPPSWPGFEPQLESSDLDSSDKKNTYKLMLYRKNDVPQQVLPQGRIANTYLLTQLVKLADKLDQVNEHEHASEVDAVILSATDVKRH